MSSQLWVVGAGKGGVGKSFVSSSLAITLSKMHHTVLLVDLDMMGASIHTSIGFEPSKPDLQDYFWGHRGLKDVIKKTSIPRVSFVQGMINNWAHADLKVTQVQKLMQECRQQNFDYIIVDLGAGHHEAQLEAFRLADEPIIVTDPESASIEKTYRFLEAFVCCKIREESTPEGFDKIVQSVRQYKEHRPQKTLSSFKTYLKNSSGFDFEFFEHFQQKPIRLIFNQARSRVDHELGYSIKSVCRKFFDLPVDYLGAIDYDNAVWQAARNREAVLMSKPFTPLAGQFLKICKSLTSSNYHATIIREVV